MEYNSKEESQRLAKTLAFLLQQKQITQDTVDILAKRDTQYMSSSNNLEYYAWIGINPSGETMTSLASALPKLPYDNYEAVIEQNTDNGIKPHIHALALVSSNTRPNKEIARLSSLFKCKSNFIEFKISSSKKLKNSRLKYLRGEKCIEKKENVKKDIQDRKLLSIPNLFSKGIL